MVSVQIQSPAEAQFTRYTSALKCNVYTNMFMSINPSSWLNSVPGRWRASACIRREWVDIFSFLESLMFPPGIPFKECCFSKNRIHEKFRWSLLFRAFSKIRSRTENIFSRVELTTWQVFQDSSYGLWITSLTKVGQSFYIWHQLSLSKLVAMFHNFPYTAIGHTGHIVLRINGSLYATFYHSCFIESEVIFIVV